MPAREIALSADRECVRVVLDNLVSNAVKFNRPGGRVRVSVAANEREVELCVADSGVGIPPDRLNLIFDRFYQVEDPMRRRFGGMGLGLSIVRDLVSLHGGRVWAESTPGEGSVFVFTLPVVADSDRKGGVGR